MVSILLTDLHFLGTWNARPISAFSSLFTGTLAFQLAFQGLEHQFFLKFV
jgi:hypothetical protein